MLETMALYFSLKMSLQFLSSVATDGLNFETLPEKEAKMELSDVVFFKVQAHSAKFSLKVTIIFWPIQNTLRCEEVAYNIFQKK